jgi:hypothetical protein
MNNIKKPNLYYSNSAPKAENIYERNILPINKLKEGMNKTIKNENEILEAYEESNEKTIFIKSIEDYRRRYRKYYISEIEKIDEKLKNISNNPSSYKYSNKLNLITKKKELEKNFRIIDSFIHKLKDSEKNKNMVTRIISQFKQTIENSKTLPSFINNSFKTRKTVGHYVRNSNIKINAKNSALITNLNQGFNGNHIQNIEDETTLKRMLGISKIRRLSRYNNNLANNNTNDDMIRNNIFQLLLEYFIDAKTEILDPTYNNEEIYNETHPKLKESALKLREKNNILLKITRELLLLDSGSEIYPTSNIKPIAQGGYGKIYKINGNIFKYEHLRFRRISSEFLKNRESVKNKIKIPYLTNNYIPATKLIPFFIQNYLYEIDNTYIPEILDYSICYESDVSLTIMKSAFEGENKTLLDFIITEVDSPTYIIDLINIIIKLCEILEIYQNACCFVHRDLNADNIIISYNRDLNGKIIPKLKIIDISHNSSVIIKYNDEYKLLKCYDIYYSRTVESVNPFLSGMWNKFDLFYFILFTLFNEEIYLVKKKLPKTHEKFKIFINILLIIFNLKDNYNEILHSINKNNTKLKFLSIFATKKEREKIFKDIDNIYLFFIPSFLKDFLEKLVITMKFEPEKNNNFISSILKFREEYNKNNFRSKITNSKYKKNMENNIPIPKFRY